MKVGILLLNRANVYVTKEGKLPQGRPSWDKAWLLKLVAGRRVVCSHNTLKTLPLTVKEACESISTDVNSDWEINLGVGTLHHKVDLLFITRTMGGNGQGKKFRLKGYEQILKQPRFEIWRGL